MSLYKKVKESKFDVPEELDITIGEMRDIVEHSTGTYDAIAAAFTYGYMQGQLKND